MQILKIASMVPLLTSVTLFATTVSAECCDPHQDGYCSDGTKGTPYCGYGPCNIFGCNCDGGCRRPGSRFTHGDVDSSYAQHVFESGEVDVDASFLADFIQQYQKKFDCKTDSATDVATCLGSLIGDIVRAHAW